MRKNIKSGELRIKVGEYILGVKIIGQDEFKISIDYENLRN